MTDAVSTLTGPPLALIGVHEPVSAARAALKNANALLVTDGGKPAAVLTRHDLLTFLSE
jgi:cystathionine beta-synthase